MLTDKIGKNTMFFFLLLLFTVGSLNGIYGIKSPFPAPTGSATESTGILFIFYKRLLSFRVSFTQK